MIYEVITGIVRIDKRSEFIGLHREYILPVYAKNSVTVICCLLTEVGEFGKFIDVYEYPSYEEYEKKSEAIFRELREKEYYPKINGCIVGNITISLMADFKDIL